MIICIRLFDWNMCIRLFDTIWVYFWTLGSCGSCAQTLLVSNHRKSFEKVIISSTGASSVLCHTTRCLSNGPRCISIRSISVSRPVALLSRSPARGIMGRRGGHQREREGVPSLSSRPACTTPLRTRPRFRHLS